MVIFAEIDHNDLHYHRAKVTHQMKIIYRDYKVVLNLRYNEKHIGILTSSLIARFTVLYAAMWQAFFVYTHVAVFTFIALVEKPSANWTK